MKNAIRLILAAVLVVACVAPALADGGGPLKPIPPGGGHLVQSVR